MKIFTDGGCSGNPGPGAWAWVLVHGPEQTEDSGFEKDTTNNRMELTAVIRALRHIDSLQTGGRPEPAEVFTDSQYVKLGITSWIKTWQKNDWITSSKTPVKNQDLWRELLSLEGSVPVAWHWVKGHAGHELNERANALVQAAMRRGMRGE